MSNNEMIPAATYTALKDFNLAEAMASEMNGMDVSFDRVTIPAAGGTTFELPGELPGETDAAKEFTGVILYHHPLFAYYRERFNGGNNAPDCGSYDGVTGAGNPGGIAYSQAKFAVDRVLTDEEQRYISAMAEQVKAFASRVAYDDAPGEVIDPETGEVMQPLA